MAELRLPEMTGLGFHLSPDSALRKLQPWPELLCSKFRTLSSRVFSQVSFGIDLFTLSVFLFIFLTLYPDASLTKSLGLN